MKRESTDMTRRGFLRAAGATGVLAATASAASSMPVAFAQDAAAPTEAAGKEVWSHCAINCPGRCPIKLHVVDDSIVSVEPYAAATRSLDGVQPRACLRGRSYRWWANDEKRLNYPMKRVEGSKRGEGRYERISWDEAISLASDNLRRVIDTYGNQAVYSAYGTGVNSVTVHDNNTWWRLLNLLGGCLTYYGSYSVAQISWISPYMFGSMTGSTLSAAVDSDLILVFGNSLVETRQGGGIAHHDWVKVREESKAEIVIIDPRCSDTAAGHSSSWLPINPGTDAALASAIAHELIVNNKIDLDFLHTYCIGYDEETLPESARGQHASYRDYIMGQGYDCIEKTPEWAESITGIPAGTISDLANKVAKSKALYVVQGWGPQRRSNGEMTSLAICMIPLLVGQVGLPGTNTGLREGSYGIKLKELPAGTNPVKAKVSVFSMIDAVDRGHEMTAEADGVTGTDKLDTDVKYIINYCGNCITNQNSDINWVHDVLVDESKCEFILGIDVVMTDSMKYSDVILPDLFRFEQTTMMGTGGDGAYMTYGTAATSPKFERKTCWEMCCMIAEKMGVLDKFTEGRTQDEWIDYLYEQTRAEDPTLPTLDEFKEMGVYVRENPKGSTVALESFRKDPEANPLKTPSGKIEIYSEKLAKHIASHRFEADDFVAPIPVYAPEWYGVETRTDEYPLLLTGFHYRGRVHSSWGDVDELKAVNPQEAWINPVDARARGINAGDKVRVSNQFGELEILAKVTQRVVPGTVAIPQGAWHDADMFGDRVDRGGCVNTLTTHRPSPLAKGNPQHTNVCQVRLIEQ